MKTLEADPLEKVAPSFYLESAALTNPGNNEPVGADPTLNLCEYGIFCVTDAVGDPVGGKKATEEIIDAIEQKFWDTKFEDEKAVRALVKEALARSKIRIKRYASEHAIEKMGAAVAVLHINPIKKSAFIVHAGDCRVYRFRDGNLTKLTQDHSVAAEMGLSDDDDISHIVQENLTRAVGLYDKINPETTTVEFQGNDIFLLSSSGLTKQLKQSEICEILSTSGGSDIYGTTSQLINKTKDHPNNEEVSLVLVKVVQEARPEEVVQNKKPFSLLFPILGTIALLVLGGAWYLMDTNSKQTSAMLPGNERPMSEEIIPETPLSSDEQTAEESVENTKQIVESNSLEHEKNQEVPGEERPPETATDIDPQQDQKNDEKVLESSEVNLARTPVKTKINAPYSEKPDPLEAESTSSEPKATREENLQQPASKKISKIEPQPSVPLQPSNALGSLEDDEDSEDVESQLGRHVEKMASPKEKIKPIKKEVVVTTKNIAQPPPIKRVETKKEISEVPTPPHEKPKEEKQLFNSEEEFTTTAPPLEALPSEPSELVEEFKRIKQTEGLISALNGVNDQWPSLTLDDREIIRRLVMKSLLEASLNFRKNNYRDGDETWETLKLAPTIQEPTLSRYMGKLLTNFKRDFTSSINLKIQKAQETCEWADLNSIIKGNPIVSLELLPPKVYTYVDVWHSLSNGSSLEDVLDVKNYVERLRLLSNKLQPLLEMPSKLETEPSIFEEFEEMSSEEICQQISKLRNHTLDILQAVNERLTFNLSIINVNDLELLLHSVYPDDKNSNWQINKLEVVTSGINQLAGLKKLLNPANELHLPQEELIMLEENAQILTQLVEEIQDHLLFVSILLKEILEHSNKEVLPSIGDLNLIYDFSKQFAAVSSLFSTEVARNFSQRFSQSLLTEN